MSYPAARVLADIVGTLLVAFVALQMFQDLFHPSQRGALSGLLGRTIFRVMRRWPRVLPAAGPIALVTVIASWVAILALGFALIYDANFPQHFVQAGGTHPAAVHSFLTCLALSFGIITTVGFGDVAPQTTWLRLVVAFQAGMGFALLTASVSWIVLLLPALSRLRALARAVTLLRDAERRGGVPAAAGDSEVLHAIAAQLVRARIDLIYFPIIYFFASPNRAASLPHVLPELVRLTDEAAAPGSRDAMRLASASVRSALDDLADVLAVHFLNAKGHDSTEVFRMYTEEHGTSGIGPWA